MQQLLGHLQLMKIGTVIFVSFALAAYSKGYPLTRHHQKQEQLAFKFIVSTTLDMSEEQAVMQSRDLITRLNLAAPDGQAQSRLYHDSLLMRTREVHLGTDYTMRFDSTSGDLISMKNERREREQLKGVYKGRPHLVQTRKQAEQLLWRIARSIGLPRNAAMTTFRWIGENDPQHADANKAASVIGGFTIPLPGGYPHNHWAQRAGMTVIMDPFDGELLELRQEWRIIAAAATPKLNSHQAVTQATASVKAYTSASHSANGFLHDGQLMFTPNTKLEYVVPNESRLVNGGMITVPKQITYPMTMRLAWVVRFGQSEVWIDAADGRQLGVIEGLFK